MPESQWSLFEGSCLDMLSGLPDNSIDSCITDPPYELSNDGKASPCRVFFELMFPENSKIKSDGSQEDCLPFLVRKILGLRSVDCLEGPSTTMEVAPVTLDGNSPCRENDVNDMRVLAIGAPDGDGLVYNEAERTEYAGCFFFEFANPEPVLDSLNSSGCGFFSGSVGVGLGVPSSGILAFLRGAGIINNSDSDVWLRDNPYHGGVSAFPGAEDAAVSRFQLTDASVDRISALGAAVFLGTAKLGGAKLVRAHPTACRLPPMLKARRISVVSNAANRTIEFDLIVHPFGISSKGFMGKAWDGSKIAFNIDVWREIYRVLKPGAHLAAFGGTRTCHRMACAIEDAGFEIRDSLAWIYGQGMPKSSDVSKAIDRADGLMDAREVTSAYTVGGNATVVGRYGPSNGSLAPVELNRTKGATEKSRAWDGWGTALRPSIEPIILARKPLIGTIAENIAAHGVGGVNVDACRIKRDILAERGENYVKKAGRSKKPKAEKIAAPPGIGINLHPDGCWPANVLIDEVVSMELGENARYFPQIELDSPGFFPAYYCAKPSTKERELGCDGLQKASAGELTQRTEGTVGISNGRAGAGRASVDGRANRHPTVKPLRLMRWLVRLLTPPGGTIVEPFAGSGTTIMAALLEGFSCRAAELTPEYHPIIRARVAWAEREAMSVSEDKNQLLLFGAK